MKKLTQSNYDWISIYGFSNSKKMKETIIKIVQITQGMGLIQKKNVVLEVSLVSSVKMKLLNKKFRKMNTPTDVLSFEIPKQFIHNNFQFLGDIVICDSIAKKQSRKYKHSIQNEFTILIVHGLLHLLGFDHEKSNVRATKMMKIESKILKKLKVKNGLIGRTLSK